MSYGCNVAKLNKLGGSVKLPKPQPNHNSTLHNLSWVWHENDFTPPTTHQRKLNGINILTRFYPTWKVSNNSNNNSNNNNNKNNNNNNNYNNNKKNNKSNIWSLLTQFWKNL